MISETITKQIASALKSKDEVRVSTLRLLSSALNYERIAKQHDLSDEEEIVVVKKEARKRQDAIEIYEKVGAYDRAEREKEELAILKEYLPKELSDNEILKIVERSIKKVGAKGIGDLGKVMGFVMKEVQVRADGKRVAELVKKKLG